MLRELLSALLLPFCFAIFAGKTHAQQVDPSYQISWSNPITGQGPISQFYNGTVQADQFAGSDMCAKINAAASYAIAHNLPIVDASHFTGVQACTSGTQPFSGFTGLSDYSPANLDIKLGNVHMTATYTLLVKNGAFTIEGLSPLQTQIEYIGSTGATAAVYIHAQTSAVTNGLEEVHFKNIFVVVRNSAATYALYTQDVNRSNFENIAAYGASGTGSANIESQGNVTTTWYRPKASQREFANLPSATWPGPYAAINTTAFGMELNSSTASGNQTTDGTVIDGAFEYMNFGLALTSANSMTFTSGTAEADDAGLIVQSVSKYNTFIGMDIEGNSVYDVQEAGTSNHYFNMIAQNVTFTSTATWDVWDDGQVQVGNFVNNAPYANGNRIQQSGFYNETPLMWANNLTGGPTTLPFSGTSHLWGGIGGMNAQLSGGELDFFTAYTASSQTACFYHNTGSGYVVDNCLGLSSFFNGTNTFGGAIVSNSSLTINGSIVATYGGAGMTYTPGTGVTSVACTSGHTCNNIRGQVTITNSSATTSQVLATIHFGSAPLSSVPECNVAQQSGAAWYGLFGNATTSQFTITNNNTVSGATTIFVAYECIQ